MPIFFESWVIPFNLNFSLKMSRSSKSFLTFISNIRISKGFGIYESAPTSSPLSLLSTEPFAVNIIMGTWFVISLFFILSQNSIPSISGIITSLMIIFGTLSNAFFNPCLPFRACIILYWPSNEVLRNRCMSVLSSTISISGNFSSISSSESLLTELSSEKLRFNSPIPSSKRILSIFPSIDGESTIRGNLITNLLPLFSRLVTSMLPSSRLTNFFVNASPTPDPV